MQHAERLVLLLVSSHWQRERFHPLDHSEKLIRICRVRKFRTQIVWISGFNREILKVEAEQQHFHWRFQSPVWLRISKLLIDIDEIKLQHSQVLGNFIIPSAKRKMETRRKWLACDLSAQLLEEEVAGFQSKPQGSIVGGKAAVSFEEWERCLESPTPLGIKAAYYAILMRAEVFSLHSLWFPKDHSSWCKFALHRLLGEAVTTRDTFLRPWTYIRDSWHLSVLSSGVGEKEPFLSVQHSETDQGISLSKHKYEKHKADEAVSFCCFSVLCFLSPPYFSIFLSASCFTCWILDGCPIPGPAEEGKPHCFKQ